MLVSGLSEVVLIVDDVIRAAEFYGEVVGLDHDGGVDESWAWFWADPDRRQRVGLHKGKLLFDDESPHSEGSRWGHVHFGFRVARERLDEAAGAVRSHGVKVFGPVDIDWMSARSYFFYDLDGNLLEFWSPSPAGNSMAPYSREL